MTNVKTLTGPIVIGLLFACGGQDRALAQQYNSDPCSARARTTHNTAKSVKPWTWTDAANKTQTWDKMESILSEHENFLTGLLTPSSPEDNTEVKCCKANFRRFTMKNAPFHERELQYAVFEKADLSSADFSGTDLEGTEFGGASLVSVDFSGAGAINANFIRADLSLADLRQTELTDADLRHAILVGTNLTGARLDGANLRGAVFEPSCLPKARDIAFAQGLSDLTYQISPGALIQLREALKQSGFNDQERRVNYAIRAKEDKDDARRARVQTYNCASLRPLVANNSRTEFPDPSGAKCSYWKVASRWIEHGFKILAFDWTCKYGMEPNRPLVIAALACLCMTLIYIGLMHVPGKSGIYRQRSRSRRHDIVILSAQIAFRKPKVSGKWKPARYIKSLRHTEFRLLRSAMMFSLMNTFNIGFRELDFGKWLRMMTFREYDLKGLGWLRPLSALQSLFSVYMLALWILCYFGRPFE